MWACENANETPQGVEIVACLLRWGADPSREDSHSLTALERLCMTSGNPRCAHMMLERGAKLIVKCDRKRTMTTLMLAALNGKKDLCIELIERWHADVWAKTEYGQTALMMAQGNSHFGVIEVLEKRMRKEEDRAKSNNDSDAGISRYKK